MKKNCPIIPAISRYILKIEEKTQTKSGFIIPETATDKTPRTSEAVIVAIPKKVIDKHGNETKPQFAVGQTVFFGQFSGTEVKIGEEKFVAIHEEDVVGVKI